jgi:hypothetical protein
MPASFRTGRRHAPYGLEQADHGSTGFDRDDDRGSSNRADLEARLDRLVEELSELRRELRH